MARTTSQVSHDHSAPHRHARPPTRDTPRGRRALASHLKPAAKSVATATAAALSRPARACADECGAWRTRPTFERRVPELCPGAQEGVMKEERSSFWGASGTLGVRLDQHWHIVAKRVRILGLECKTKGFVETMLLSW